MTWTITSGFGMRADPESGEQRFHKGIDIAAPVGTPVVAVAPGVVERVDVDGVDRGVVNGNAVHLRDNAGVRWSYLHLSRAAVSSGTRVRGGQVIGRVGMTGRSYGPHLHLQATYGGEPIDPVPLFPPNTFRMRP